MRIPVGEATHLDYQYIPPRADAGPEPRETWEDVYQRALQSVEGLDLIDELTDIGDLLAALARSGKSQQIGTIVCAVYRAYAERLADRECYGSARPGKFPADVARRLA